MYIKDATLTNLCVNRYFVIQRNIHENHSNFISEIEYYADHHNVGL